MKQYEYVVLSESGELGTGNTVLKVDAENLNPFAIACSRHFETINNNRSQNLILTGRNLMGDMDTFQAYLKGKQEGKLKWKTVTIPDDVA